MLMGLDTVANGDRTVESHKPMLQPAYPSTNILGCGGDDEKDEMGMRKSDAYWTVNSDKLMLKPADTIGRCSVQGCPDHDEMDTLLAKEMASEAERFASYVRSWEFAWGRTCGFFRDMTALSSMQFTHYTPGQKLNSGPASATQTLQIFSIKLTEIAVGLKWPLSVYGLVAVRDVADHNRNLLFSRNRSQAQELKEDDRILRLIGPSRAIVFTDRVDFEIQLKVKGTGTSKSQDKALISYADCYDGGYGSCVSTFSVSNCFCTLEFCVQTVTRTFQATILDVQVVKDDGSWPFEYGGRFSCSPLSGKFVFTDSGVTHAINHSSSQIVLLDSKDGAWLKQPCGGYLHMWRQVVSVEIEGRLDVFIQAYSKSGDIASHGEVRFIPKSCGMSHGKCALGGSEVSITVAWSLVATDKGTIATQGNLFEC
ncbi:hypothetical protein CFC21_094205 [Triticum aestivum]|uniref:DUF6598 domain-containing protein n=4 Tax=Triticinae TaxID=1648030 RepID=A0A9R1LMP2_WHEAT|nr:uncharacterized protein LOC123145887 [Triticum aestivum]KAF7091651.1 hypothetical protein CFC21_094205 [Triticum aestivum]